MHHYSNNKFHGTTAEYGISKAVKNLCQKRQIFLTENIMSTPHEAFLTAIITHRYVVRPQRIVRYQLLILSIYFADNFACSFYLKEHLRKSSIRYYLYPFMYRVNGTMLIAVATLQTVVLADDKRFAFINCTFRTDALTRSTAYTVITYFIAFWLPFCIAHGEIITENRMISKIEVFYHGILNAIDDSNLTCVAWIDIDKIGLFLKNLVHPFLLVFSFMNLARQTDHLFILCQAFHLDISACFKLVGEALSSCGIEVDGIRFKVDGADTPYLGTIVGIYCCKVQSRSIQASASTVPS